MKPTADELSVIPSIWDGWQQQCINEYFNGEASCARGYILKTHIKKFTTMDPRDDEYARSIYRRVAAYIREHIGNPSPMHLRECGGATPEELANNRDVQMIVYGNDYFGLTPDGFRYIDRLTQWEEMRKQIDALPAPQPAVEERV